MHNLCKFIRIQANVVERVDDSRPSTNQHDRLQQQNTTNSGFINGFIIFDIFIYMARNNIQPPKNSKNSSSHENLKAWMMALATSGKLLLTLGELASPCGRNRMQPVVLKLKKW